MYMHDMCLGLFRLNSFEDFLHNNTISVYFSRIFVKICYYLSFPPGGVAAYNFGVNNVQSWANLDVGTTGGDYSNDVIARAQWLVTGHGW